MAAIVNELYFVVLPTVQIGGNTHGLTTQVLTLMPDKNFATRFFDDEVEAYIATFKNRLNLFIGGHVKGYDFFKEFQGDGRVVVKVIQLVG
jgi:hypothetical protein